MVSNVRLLWAGWHGACVSDSFSPPVPVCLTEMREVLECAGKRDKDGGSWAQNLREVRHTRGITSDTWVCVPPAARMRIGAPPLTSRASKPIIVLCWKRL